MSNHAFLSAPKLPRVRLDGRNHEGYYTVSAIYPYRTDANKERVAIIVERTYPSGYTRKVALTTRLDDATHLLHRWSTHATRGGKDLPNVRVYRSATTGSTEVEGLSITALPPYKRIPFHA